MIAHHIMLTSPEKTGQLPNLAGWGELRLERSKNETYADAMMAYGCRASTAATLFPAQPEHTAPALCRDQRREFEVRQRAKFTVVVRRYSTTRAAHDHLLLALPRRARHGWKCARKR